MSESDLTREVDEDSTREIKTKITNMIEQLTTIRDSDEPGASAIFAVAISPTQGKGEGHQTLTLVLGGETLNSVRLTLAVDSGQEMLKEALRETVGVASHWDHIVGTRLKRELKMFISELNDSQPEENNRGDNKQRRH